MYEAMTTALEGASADDSVGCVLIAGVPGVFSAGGGLNRPALRFLPALVRRNKPMVAAVSGVAVGVGTTMLFHCDFVVAGLRAYERCDCLRTIRRSARIHRTVRFRSAGEVE
jgi:enoyl-CoA hydratase/carnithine racemase